jgi:hypothetical protein
MDDSIICRYEWTAAQEEQALREHSRLFLRPATQWFGRTILFAVMVLLAAGDTSRASYIAWAIFFVIGTPILCGPLGPFEPWLQRRRFARRRDAGVTIEWTANEEGLRVKTGDLARSEVAWKAITKCARVRHGFLIYGTEICGHGEAIFHLLPDSGFASPELAVRFGSLAEQRALRFENHG